MYFTSPLKNFESEIIEIASAPAFWYSKAILRGSIFLYIKPSLGDLNFNSEMMLILSDFRAWKKS